MKKLKLDSSKKKSKEEKKALRSKKMIQRKVERTNAQKPNGSISSVPISMPITTSGGDTFAPGVLKKATANFMRSFNQKRRAGFCHDCGNTVFWLGDRNGVQRPYENDGSPHIHIKKVVVPTIAELEEKEHAGI